jgi:hypothetical protein
MEKIKAEVYSVKDTSVMGVKNGKCFYVYAAECIELVSEWF